jgi:hypothetical protein
VLWQIFSSAQTLIGEGQSIIDLVRPLISEGRPNFEVANLISVALIALGAALFVILYQSPSRAPKAPTNLYRTDWLDLWASRYILLGCSLIIGLFMLAPMWFTSLAQEDSLIENLSAALCFLSGATFLYIFASRRRNQFNSTADKSLLIVAAAISFLIGFEEVSWFQRSLDIELPEFFENNSQEEMNLHNYHTDLAENLYYGGAFVCFVLIPFLGLYTNWIQQLRLVKFMPGMAALIVIAISCSYNYDMWVGIPTQIAFWMAIFIVVGQARRAPSATWAFMLWGSVYLMCLSQIMYLVNGEVFVRLWDITEYKEFLIATGIFLYALELLARMRDATGADQCAPA